LLMVLKITANGDTLWTKSYENLYSYSCQSLIKCPEGGYAGIATIDINGETGSLYQIIRFNENGDTLWTKNPTSESLLSSVSMTSDGGFIIAGMEFNEDSDLLLIKTDSKGEKEWSKTFKGGTWDMGYDAKQTIDGGYIIAGTITSSKSAGSDAWLIKTDHLGNKIWSNTYGGKEENERAFQVFITTDNGYYVSGNVKHLFWVARLDADTLTTLLTGVSNPLQSDYQLNQNYPNPFSSITDIEYSVPSTSRVNVSVFNMLGKEVIQLADKTVPSGKYNVSWNGEDEQGNRNPPGFYIYRIMANGFMMSKKCVLIK
jgi:hypothetical protein